MAPALKIYFKKVDHAVLLEARSFQHLTVRQFQCPVEILLIPGSLPGASNSTRSYQGVQSCGLGSQGNGSVAGRELSLSCFSPQIVFSEQKLRLSQQQTDIVMGIKIFGEAVDYKSKFIYKLVADIFFFRGECYPLIVTWIAFGCCLKK